MNSVVKILGLTGGLLAVLLMSGCSMNKWFDEKLPDKRKIDYKTSRQEKSLEVPPDLTQPGRDNTMALPEAGTDGSATYSDYNAARGRTPLSVGGNSVLPEFNNIKYYRNEDKAWLLVQATPQQLWPEVRDFWVKNGFLLTVDNPNTGVLETDWAENRANIADGAIRRVLSKAFDSLYSSGTRDKFRVRLEAGATPGTTEVYLSHRGMQEVYEGGETIERSGSVWVPSETDPGLEAEMLKRLMIHLGVAQEQAQRTIAQPTRRAPQAKLLKSSKQLALLLNADSARAWRYTGLALDRVGFSVEDRDRAKGIYYVRYNDPNAGKKKKGFLSKLAFWSSDEKPDPSLYQVKLEEAQGGSQVVIRSEQGEPLTSGTAERILTLLYEQLK